MSDQKSDFTLIRRIARAEHEALDQFYERYSRLVFGVAVAILGEQAVAEEVTLDVFVRVWQRAGTYRPERGEVRTWLIAITRHHAIDILRSQKSRPDPLDLTRYEALLPDETAGTEIEDQVHNSLQAERVWQALAELPPEQRQALYLAYFGGLTHSEIADMLKEPLGTIKSRIHAGMQRLRKILEEHQP